jgi:starch phosphorylase
MNLSWRWDRDARALLKQLDPTLWSVTRHNPVDMLRRIDEERLKECARDARFVGLYDCALSRLQDQQSSRDGTWFARHFPELTNKSIAYFCAEFGLHNSVPIYSGGLGVLAGDHCKAASDLGVPLVGVGLLYHKGYFDQKIRLDGWQEDADEVFDPAIMPLERLRGPGGDPWLAAVRVSERTVYVGAWRMWAGRVPLYLLDTNLEQNDPVDRELTYKLYGGGQEYRLRQEIILGIGGVRVLRSLGIEPSVWHANEGHAGLMMIERLREYLEAGMPEQEAISKVRDRTVFTTHTPVPAGHDTFPPSLIESCLRSYYERMGISRDRLLELGGEHGLGGDLFHMTALAMRLSRHVNGVSKKHGQVTREMWAPMWPSLEGPEIPIGSITNGVHLGSWMSHRIMELFDEKLGRDWESRADDPELWDVVDEISDRRLWEVHMEMKGILLDFAREQARRRWRERRDESEHLVGAGTLLSRQPLLLGFARRFARYKRADLLFRDEERLRALLTDTHRPVQLVVAGKAHPADTGAKEILQRIYAATRDGHFEGRIAFIEDYELHVAHRLVQGVDLWLNLPRVPLEASGTSGMKAGLNGVPQLGTVDGWWAEGYNGENGWAIPPATEEDEDQEDWESLFGILEEEVVPLFYERSSHSGVPHGWVRCMKEAIRVAGRDYTTGRMVRDYTERYYVPAMHEPAGDRLPPDRAYPAGAAV